MSNYHVGCGIGKIYAGTLNKSGDKWLNKSDVTKEAVDAVVMFMYSKIPNGEDAFAYGFKMRDGKYVRLKVEAWDTRPFWAREELENDG